MMSHRCFLALLILMSAYGCRPGLEDELSSELDAIRQSASHKVSMQVYSKDRVNIKANERYFRILQEIRGVIGDAASREPRQPSAETSWVADLLPATYAPLTDTDLRYIEHALSGNVSPIPDVPEGQKWLSSVAALGQLLVRDGKHAVSRSDISRAASFFNTADRLARGLRSEQKFVYYIIARDIETRLFQGMCADPRTAAAAKELSNLCDDIATYDRIHSSLQSDVQEIREVCETGLQSTIESLQSLPRDYVGAEIAACRAVRRIAGMDLNRTTRPVIIKVLTETADELTPLVPRNTTAQALRRVIQEMTQEVLVLDQRIQETEGLRSAVSTPHK